VELDSAHALIEVSFPAVRTEDRLCTHEYGAPGQRRREATWRLWASFPDANVVENHAVFVELHFLLPTGVRLTRVRFDSAVAATTIRAFEVSGEPPIFGSSYSLGQARLLPEGDRLRLLAEGREVVDAFLRTGMDSVVVAWCDGQEFPAVRLVPLGQR